MVDIPPFLRDYDNDKVISADLKEVKDKHAILNSGALEKLSYWWNGTYQAKQTAANIDIYMKQHFSDDKLSKLTSSDLANLKKIKEKLEILNVKFIYQKKINTLNSRYLAIAKRVTELETAAKLVPSQKVIPPSSHPTRPSNLAAQEKIGSSSPQQPNVQNMTNVPTHKPITSSSSKPSTVTAKQSDQSSPKPSKTNKQSYDPFSDDTFPEKPSKKTEGQHQDLFSANAPKNTKNKPRDASSKKSPQESLAEIFKHPPRKQKSSIPPIQNQSTTTANQPTTSTSNKSPSTEKNAAISTDRPEKKLVSKSKAPSQTSSRIHDDSLLPVLTKFWKVIYASQPVERSKAYDLNTFKSRLEKLDEKTNNNLFRAAKVLTDIRNGLSQECHEACEKMRSRLIKEENFSTLAEGFFNTEIEGILNDVSKTLMNKMKNINKKELISVEQWKKFNEQLYAIGHEKILKDLETALVNFCEKPRS